MEQPKTQDQKFYEVNGQLKAEIDVYISSERDSAPSIQECRHAVLQLHNEGNGYVIYDRLLGRIVNGVFYMPLEEVLDIAAYYNKDGTAPQDMAPNGAALGLKYPVKKGRRA